MNVVRTNFRLNHVKEYFENRHIRFITNFKKVIFLLTAQFVIEKIMLTAIK